MRWLVTAVCAFVIAALAVVTFAPNRDGTWHAQFGPGLRATILSLAPDSPWAKAGVRPGNVLAFDRMTLTQRTAVTLPKIGVPVTIIVERGASTSRLTAIALAGHQKLWFDVATRLLALLYASMALLVAWRAPRGRTRGLILAMLCGLSVGFAASRTGAVFALSEGEALSQLVESIGIVIFLVAAILFVVEFPPRQSLLLRYVRWVGVPVCILAALVFAAYATNDNYRLFSFDLERANIVGLIAGAVVMLVGVIDGIASATAEYRVPARVAGSTLLILAAANTTIGLSAIFHWHVPILLLDLLEWTAGFGVAYAVLRHRLLDLNLVISRAAIFSAVSLSLIAIFVIAEWAIASILEHAIGPGFGENGKTALAAGVALCVGLSARGVHQVIEHRLNRIFFAKRYRGLADLHRFALETDSTTDATALLELTLNNLRRNLDVQYVALYTGTPQRGYLAVGTTTEPNVPLRLDQNEETVLRLRRWGEAFVVEHEQHPLRGAFVSPMMLRGTLYGFVICGPKGDRTRYLPDEEQAVAALIHRVGIAFEWLTRPMNAERV